MIDDGSTNWSQITTAITTTAKPLRIEYLVPQPGKGSYPPSLRGESNVANLCTRGVKVQVHIKRRTQARFYLFIRFVLGTISNRPKDIWCKMFLCHRRVDLNMLWQIHYLETAESVKWWTNLEIGAYGLWLAIRFKITTGYTRVFLPRILVYIRYVWALSSYIRPFRSRIYAFLKGHIFA